jgi:hypothetical protein
MKTDLTTEHRRQLRGRRLVGGAIATAAVCLLGIAFVASHEVTAQAQAQAEPQPMERPGPEGTSGRHLQ